MMASETAGTTKNLSTSQVDGNHSVAEQSLITIYIMGKAYEVPADATIMGAIEYAGHQIIRGAGCREGNLRHRETQAQRQCHPADVPDSFPLCRVQHLHQILPAGASGHGLYSGRQTG